MNACDCGAIGGVAGNACGGACGGVEGGSGGCVGEARDEERLPPWPGTAAGEAFSEYEPGEPFGGGDVDQPPCERLPSEPTCCSVAWMFSSSCSLWSPWMKRHLFPYGQTPVSANVRHTRVLYCAGRRRARMSLYPCANWHLSP